MTLLPLLLFCLFLLPFFLIVVLFFVLLLVFLVYIFPGKAFRSEPSRRRIREVMRLGEKSYGL